MESIRGLKNILERTNPAESWVLKAENLSVTGHKQEALSVLESGLSSDTSYVSEDDIVNAVNLYFDLSNASKFQTANTLLSKLSDKGLDYVSSLKCKYSPSADKLQCYKNFYVTYPNGKYTDKALAEIFLAAVRANDTINAKKIGQELPEQIPR